MKSFAFITVLLTLMITSTSAAEREYLIYDSAGEYALAWGCEGRLVDFYRFDMDLNYQDSVFASCVVNNYVINLFEDRVMSTTANDYYPTRTINMNHQNQSLAKLGYNIIDVLNNPGSAEAFAIEDSSKWESTTTILISILPYVANGVALSELYTCSNCSELALKAVLAKTGWAKNLTESFAWNISFKKATNPSSGIDYLTAQIEGGIPKGSAYASLLADIDLTFDYATKTFSLSVAKLLKATYEQ